MKTCTKCHVSQPVENFQRLTAAPDGRRPRCRSCTREDERIRYATQGGREKARAAYHRDPEAARRRVREWVARNRLPKPKLSDREKEQLVAERYQRKLAARKRTYEKNKSKVLAQAAIYRAAHKAEEKRNRAAHYQKNKEKVARDTEAYRLSNPGLYAAAAAKRRCAKRKACVSWASEVAIAAIYDEAQRLSRETGVPHEVDHIVPIQGKNVCGLHWEGNLQILTEFENRSKANSH